ncbi:MAG: SpoIIE family protein phosphatase [Candidatus Aminicenantales bacterium]
MASGVDIFLRQQLVDRRYRLERASSAGAAGLQVEKLIHEVDAALDRMGAGSYGLCDVCHEPIEAERLISDPLSRFCLEHLTPPQQRALESDLELAAKIQGGLLPVSHLLHGGWEASFRYEPASIVSGDYCDLVRAPSGDLYFMLGDVTGKGVAASMLTVHLQAMFRTLIPMGLPLSKLVEHASRIFSQSTLPTHFATLVCGRAADSGEIEVCNAGHLPPLLITERGVDEIEPTGLPLGAFSDAQFATSRNRVEPGQAILLYTDGLSEARDRGGRMYGSARIRELVLGRQRSSPDDLIEACMKDLAAFRKDVPAGDDLTIMAVRRDPGPPVRDS